MTDTPLDLDYIEHRMASPMVTYRENVKEDMPALVAALRKAQAEVERLRKPHRACEACGCDGCEYCQDEALIVRAEKAEAQVAAVLALCDQAAPRRMGDGYLSASVLAPEDVRAAVEGAGDVPMSPDMGHDLRERIAQRIDQAWAEANDRRPRSEYREGYLDGLEHAEAVARSTPLTVGVAPLDVEAPQYDRIERDASRTAHAALIAELRALPRADLTDTGERPGRWVVIDADDLDAALDRHAPEGETP